jgi:hypothetical protein
MLKILIDEQRSRTDCDCVIDESYAKELSHDPHGNGVETKARPQTALEVYARCEDFRTVFLENLDYFHQLCLLLTRNLDKAEQCLMTGLDDCIRSQHVSKAWIHYRAKRMLIQNAIRMLQPSPTSRESSWPTPDFPYKSLTAPKEYCFDIARVLELEDFERFVFVLSVLDQHSDRDCAFLLDSSVEDIRNARINALEQLAASISMGHTHGGE